MSGTTSTAPDVRETRLALAFSGGVALAVYESGVAVEFFRLVKGEGVYDRLREHTGKVVVDVISGSSAGGINGAFLANALVNGGDMSRLAMLWRDQGDIDQLLYGPFKSNPDSLLDGDQLLEKVFEALLSKRNAPVNERTLQPSMDLFVTSTNLDGDRVMIRTPDGEEIPTRTHRQIFHFAYRKKDADTEARNDFASDDDLCLLAQAARATSSFPLAFAPVLVKKGLLGRRALWLEADAYHVDGGVLDNLPIDLALQAIGSRRSDKEVTRMFFYIEPDPEQIAPRACQTAPRSFSAPEVVLKALVGLPGYQSLTSALQHLERHNRSVHDRRTVLSYFEDVVAARGARRPEEGHTGGKLQLLHA